MQNSLKKLPEQFAIEASEVASQVSLTAKQRKLWASWIENLRSGNYEQTYEVLCDKFGYCCLGVLVTGDRPEIDGVNVIYYDDAIIIDDLDQSQSENSVLPPRLREHYGLHQKIHTLEYPQLRNDKELQFRRDGSTTILTSLHDLCTTLNDEHNLTFPQIADFLEIIMNGAKDAEN